MRLKAIILMLMVLVTGCRNGVKQPGTAEPVRVRLTALSLESVSIPVHSTGILVSSEEMKLSFKTGGIVERILVNEGDRVKRGDLLASLNLSEIEAQVTQARTGYEKALRDLSRAENLFRDSVATLEQRQNAESALSVARSALKIAQFNFDHSRIVAPDNGLILKKFVRENELVPSGYPVFLFGSSGRSWKVKTGLPDKDIVRVNTGDSASVAFDAWPGEVFRAAVEQVGEISNPMTGTYEVELMLQETRHRLASGFIGAVDIYPSDRKRFILVPVESVVDADGHEGYVYLLSDDRKTVRKVRIRIEAVDGSRLAVTGIPGGIGEVVSEGAPYLRDGINVEVVK